LKRGDVELKETQYAIRDRSGGRFSGHELYGHVANRRPTAIVQCGYSSFEGCENTIGKGAMCFVNPYVAINDRRTAPVDGVTARKG
jgi:hypothetical protein